MRVSNHPTETLRPHLTANSDGHFPPPETVQRIYDGVASVYDAYYDGFRERAENRLIRGRLLGMPLPLLDFGCGTGLTLDLVPISPRRYMGIDLSPRMLAWARMKHPRHLFIEADMMRVQRRHYYGSAVCLFAAYLVDPDQLLDAMARSLTSYGRGLIVTPTKGREHWGPPTIDHLTGARPTACEWANMAARYFRGVAIRGMTRWPLPWPLNALESRLYGRRWPDRCSHLIIELGWPHGVT